LRWHDSTFWGVEPCTSWLSHWEIVETNSLKPLEVLDKYSKKKSSIWLAEQDTTHRPCLIHGNVGLTGFGPIQMVRFYPFLLNPYI
jgi:hypothetical protein